LGQITDYHQGDQLHPIHSLLPDLLYHEDSISPAEAKSRASGIKPFANNVFKSKMSCEPWRCIPSTYVICEIDRALPVEVQEAMVGRTQGMFNEGKDEVKAFGVVERCASGHTPWVSMPEVVVEFIVKAAGGMEE